jgi:hypothetical protein
MTSGAPIDSSGEPLAVLHTRLDAHFRALRESRDEHAIGTPIFALEHGLTDAEVALMKVAVCSAVREQRIPRRNWLPFVVYAAEIGYEYSGDEYWAHVRGSDALLGARTTIISDLPGFDVEIDAICAMP